MSVQGIVDQMKQEVSFLKYFCNDTSVIFKKMLPFDFGSSETKKGDLIRTLTKTIGQEESSKRDREQQFHSMIETFQKEKKELDEELNFLRGRWVYQTSIID